ncbi:sigma-70 family RNA polymerase sigma factor [Paenibacillus sp. GD4]|uniref:sigma-70 family RNA polymerase sigma factor n=1 Tax=Paenibacillus sp. GD4 TaxID=3068890 RepID=UPI002796D9BC|nr:sigma-70 family RNA polymerase sigma factor [Paenibacillus sp. GD4]MDQ1910825.1 sigma-70 family RNA polymerase sigma factor [Paenibacillus sp. GD4]
MRVALRVKQAQRGNKEALLQLILAEKDVYYRLALAYMGQEHDAMDALEEMIVILYEKIGQLKKPDSFYSWSRTILVNHCKAVLKRRNKVILIEDWENSNGMEPETVVVSDPYEQLDRHMDIRSSLERVNPDQKEAIELKYFHDLDYESIARIMNVSVGTAKSRVFNGLKKLKEWYGGE